MKIKEQWVKAKGGEVKKLFDMDSDMTFRRILGGLGWPHNERQGFVLVMAEDFEPDHSIPNSPHHFRILAEHETSDLEELQRYCHKFEDDFCLGSVLGNPDSPIHEIWKKQKGHPTRVALPHDYEKIDMNLIAQLIKKNTQSRKTLHFGDSKIPGYLTRFMADRIENELIEQYPPMAAFGFALVQMELHGGFTRPHFTPDRSGTTRVNSRIRRR